MKKQVTVDEFFKYAGRRAVVRLRVGDEEVEMSPNKARNIGLALLDAAAAGAQDAATVLACDVMKAQGSWILLFMQEMRANRAHVIPFSCRARSVSYLTTGVKAGLAEFDTPPELAF